jgi:hypothetical protein
MNDLLSGAVNAHDGLSRWHQLGVASDKSGPWAVSHRQRSQRHLDYAL